MNNRFRFKALNYVLTLLAVLSVLSGCASPKPDMKFIDLLSPASPKGYIEFFSPDGLAFYLYCVEDEQKAEITFSLFPRPGGKGVRIAKAPGDYTFIVRHNDFMQTIKIRVVKDAVVFVTGYQNTVSSRISRDAGGNMIVHSAYYFDLVVGTRPVPLRHDAAAVPLLLAALSDMGARTRLIAIEALGKLELSQNKTALAALNEVAVFDPHIDVRKAAIQVLKRAGQEPQWPTNALMLGNGQDAPFRGWFFRKDATGVSSFEAGKYTMQSITSDCTWQTIRPALAPPKNYDVELTSTWTSGVQDREYGLILGRDNKFYSFGASCSKQANIQFFKDNQVKENVLPWKPATTLCQGNGKAANKQRIEVRGDAITYYVNDALVGTIEDDLWSDDRFFGVKVCGKQKVVFEKMSIQGK